MGNLVSLDFIIIEILIFKWTDRQTNRQTVDSSVDPAQVYIYIYIADHAFFCLLHIFAST